MRYALTTALIVLLAFGDMAFAVQGAETLTPGRALPACCSVASPRAPCAPTAPCCVRTPERVPAPQKVASSPELALRRSPSAVAVSVDASPAITTDRIDRRLAAWAADGSPPGERPLFLLDSALLL